MQIVKLTKKQESEMLSQGFTMVTFKGVTLKVNADGTYSVEPYNGTIVNPLDAGSKRLVLTLKQGEELAKTGNTTHTKEGITYSVKSVATEGGIEYVATPLVDSVVTHLVTSDSIIELR